DRSVEPSTKLCQSIGTEHELRVGIDFLGVELLTCHFNWLAETQAAACGLTLHPIQWQVSERIILVTPSDIGMRADEPTLLETLPGRQCDVSGVLAFW